MKIIKKLLSDRFSLLVLLVFLFAFFIRVIGIYPGHPANHPDEPITYLTAIQMVLERNLDPFSFSSYKFQYPGFLIYLDVLLFTVLFIPIGLLITAFSNPSFFLNYLGQFDELIRHVVGPGWINAVFWGRYVVAVLGFFGVVLTYFIGKNIFNKHVGLLAALFVAINYRHNASSHLSLVDAPNSTMALLALLFSLRLLDKPTRTRYLLAGVAVGLSLATKLYFFSIVCFLLVHIIISLRKRKINLIVKSLFHGDFILGVFCFVGIFLLFNPFLIFHIQTAIYTHYLNNLRYGLGVNSLANFPLWYLYELGFGKPLSWLFFIGIVLSFLNKKYWIKVGLLLLFIAIPAYVLIYYSNAGGYVRNFTSVIPFAAIFSAYGFYQIYQFFIQKIKLSVEKTVVLFFIGGIIVSFSQFKNSASMSYWLSHQWTRDCISQEMEKTLRSGEKVSRTPNVPNVTSKKVDFVFHSNFYIKKTAYSLAELQEEKVEHLVINTDYIMSAFIWWTGTGTRFWGMPIAAFDNSFEGLAVKELSRYSVAECIYPFPYIAENFFMMKIPPQKIPDNTTLVKTIDKTITVEPKSAPFLPEKFIISDFIPVKSNTKYLITGVIKAGEELPLEIRDGFIRVDFYPDKIDKKKKGIATAISSRYFGKPEMQEKKLTVIVPNNAQYMVISFQIENYKSEMSLQDVKIFEVNEKISTEEIEWANKKEIDDLVIYPQSIL